MTIRRTDYQASHRPTSVTQILCNDTHPLDGNDLCHSCGRWLLRGGRNHKPNVIGSLGWIEHYSDGSTYIVEPGQTPKRVR